MWWDDLFGKPLKIIGLALLLLSVLSLHSLPAEWVLSDTQYDNLTTQLATSDVHIAQLETSLETRTHEVVTLHTEVQTLQQDLTTIEQQHTLQGNQINGLEAFLQEQHIVLTRWKRLTLAVTTLWLVRELIGLFR